MERVSRSSSDSTITVLGLNEEKDLNVMNQTEPMMMTRIHDDEDEKDDRLS